MLIGLESVVCGHKKSACNFSQAEEDRHIEQLNTASQHCDLAIKVQLNSENAVDLNIFLLYGKFGGIF